MSRSVLERIYHERRNDLIRYCEALLLHDPKYRAQAEEIVQDAFMSAIARWEQLRGHPNLYGWLLTTCRNKCQSMVRRDLNRQRITGVQVAYDDEEELSSGKHTGADPAIARQQDAILRWLEATEAREKLETLQAQLSPLEQRVYAEYFLHGSTLKDAARKLGIKMEAVNDAVRRIRRKALRMEWSLLLTLLPLLHILTEGRLL